MTLGAGHGDTVTLTADDEAVLDSLAALLARDLDAE
jgi:phosphotransferase system HPr-like phosphotransfer protein